MLGRNAGVSHNTEDKRWWCQHGERLELAFVDICKAKLGLSAAINPAKKRDRYAPDLVVGEILADLKVQNTPFFVSKSYGLDPRRTVTFNRKDYERYRLYYPEIDIYFWVEWTQTESDFGRVDYLAGIYRLPFADVARLIEGGAAEHEYKHRRNDTQGNARSSFLLSLDDFEILFEKS